jgi:phosphoglycolate phosphatase
MEQLMRRKIAVFDLDGTLINTAPDLLDSLNHTLLGTGVAEVPETGFNTVVGHGGRAMIAKAYANARKDLAKDTHEQLFGRFIDHYGANIPGRSLPYPGVVDALDRFQAAGFLLAVCTNKTEALSLRLIGALGLTSRFAAICGLDTFGFCKPDPRHLLETIAKAGGDPDKAIMVGDSRTDIDTAKAAGIPVVAVDFGYTDMHVREFGPSRIISHYDELTVAMAEGLIAAANPAVATAAR